MNDNKTDIILEIIYFELEQQRFDQHTVANQPEMTENSILYVHLNIQ